MQRCKKNLPRQSGFRGWIVCCYTASATKWVGSFSWGMRIKIMCFTILSELQLSHECYHSTSCLEQGLLAGDSCGGGRCWGARRSWQGRFGLCLLVWVNPFRYRVILCCPIWHANIEWHSIDSQCIYWSEQQVEDLLSAWHPLLKEREREREKKKGKGDLVAAGSSSARSCWGARRICQGSQGSDGELFFSTELHVRTVFYSPLELLYNLGDGV